MFRGIYANAKAMDALMVQQDVHANNLANVNTTGFKKDTVRFREFKEILRGQEVVVPEPETSFDRDTGPLVPTGNPLDLAVQGAGSFAVETPDGVRYTRNGCFQWDADGKLVDGGGRTVVGTGGVITRKTEASGPLTVQSDGTLTMGDTTLGRIKVVEFSKDSAFEKVGESLIRQTQGEAKTGKSQVIQGYLESSTVNSVREMADMTHTLRLFESNQKALRLQDEALSRAIQDLSR